MIQTVDKMTQHCYLVDNSEGPRNEQIRLKAVFFVAGMYEDSLMFKYHL